MPDNWRQDSATGLWWNGVEDGPYNDHFELVPTDAPGVIAKLMEKVQFQYKPSEKRTDDDGSFKAWKAAQKLAEKDQRERSKVPSCGLITTSSTGFPRSRKVVCSGMSSDMSTLTLDTAAGTSEVTEIEANSRITVFFQTDKWSFSLLGNATVAKDGERAQILVEVRRLEVVDQYLGIVGPGKYVPMVLEFNGEDWLKLQ